MPGREEFAPEDNDAAAGLVEAPRLDVDDAAIGLAGRLAQIQDFGFRVQRVSGKQRLLEGDDIVAEIRDGLAAGIGDAHADSQAEDQRIGDGTAPEWLLLGEMLVDVEGMLIHGEQREPRIIVLRDGAAGPVLVDRADCELFIVAAKSHQCESSRYFSMRRRAMISRWSSLVPPPITTRGASR